MVAAASQTGMQVGATCCGANLGRRNLSRADQASSVDASEDSSNVTANSGEEQGADSQPIG